MAAKNEQKSCGLFRNDAVRTDGKRDDYVMVYHEKDAVTVIDGEIKYWMLVPSDTLQFVTSKRRVAPIGAEERKPGARHFLDLRRKFFEFAFEADSPPEDHKSRSISSGESNTSGSIGSFLCASTSAKSLAVGFRAGTEAANSTGSKGTSTSLFFTLAFILSQVSLMNLKFQSKTGNYDYDLSNAIGDRKDIYE
jgi:hypothetical protein